MTAQISNRLKTIFMLYAIFAFILGFLYLLMPVAWGNLVDWIPAQPFDHRIIGAAFLAFGLGAWLAARKTSWDQVSVVVQMNLVWTVLATALMVWGMVAGGLPTLGWVYVVAVGGFALAFLMSYFEHSRG